MICGAHLILYRNDAAARTSTGTPKSAIAPRASRSSGDSRRDGGSGGGGVTTTGSGSVLDTAMRVGNPGEGRRRDHYAKRKRWHLGLGNGLLESWGSSQQVRLAGPTST